jgi:hypothetical protein
MLEPIAVAKAQRTSNDWNASCKCFSVAHRHVPYIFYKDMNGRLRSEYLCFIPSTAHTRGVLKFGDTFIFGVVIDTFLNTQRRWQEEYE